MIEGNRIKFGYGDIVIGVAVGVQTLVFKQLKSPLQCGADVPDNYEVLGDPISIKIDYYDYCNLLEMLEAVREKRYSTIYFKDYWFDFTNYNEKSIKILEQRARTAIAFQLLAIAC